MVETRIHDGELVAPVESLERYFKNGGATVLQAAFEHSYFADPDRVRQKTPLYPDRARFSREHYPNLKKGDRATWKGQDVKLDDNSAAQRAWAKYSRRPIARASGYGVRHVWGHPWNPDAFTAGWNLCYMPFWAGMLTERRTLTENWNWRFARQRGICTSATIRCAPRRTSSPIPVSIWTGFSVGNPF